LIDYQLRYSDKRRTLALQIKQGQLFVRAPSYLSKQDIERFIITKSAWLEKKLALFNENEKLHFSFKTGESLLIKGVHKRFLWQLGEKESVEETAKNIEITLTEPQKNNVDHKLRSKELLEQWCFQDVSHYLNENLPRFIKQLNVSPNAVKVRRYKSRWGSCNSKKNLTFNLLLAMVPRDVFDYVIIHELAHLTHMNHSADFWQLVATHHPDYKKNILWLKRYQQQLNFV
jgi:predicted metal-dependent hydrolase